MAASAGVAIAIIGIRAITLMGVVRAFAGVILPAAVILAITLVAAVMPRLQGILLTAEAIGFFVVAMMLLPKIRLPEAAPVAVVHDPVSGATTPPARRVPLAMSSRRRVM